MDTTRPVWLPAQVTVESSKDFHIVMEGQATNGGFAIDDISITPGSCQSENHFSTISKLIVSIATIYIIFTARPEKAAIKNQAKAA